MHWTISIKVKTYTQRKPATGLDTKSSSRAVAMLRLRMVWTRSRAAKKKEFSFNWDPRDRTHITVEPLQKVYNSGPCTLVLKVELQHITWSKAVLGNVWVWSQQRLTSSHFPHVIRSSTVHTYSLGSTSRSCVLPSSGFIPKGRADSGTEGAGWGGGGFQ